VLTLWDLRKVMVHEGEAGAQLTARDLKTAEVISLHPEDDFETAFHLLEKKELSFLPVVLPPGDEVVMGVLRIEDAVAAYNQRLLKQETLRYPIPGEAKRE